MRNGGNLTDRDLVVAFKGGDAHAYALIYRDYRPLAESICQRILMNPDDAAEAAQETMLKVFQGLPRFNGRYLLRAWVARIATNVCLDMIRKRHRRIDEVDSPDAEALEATETTVLRAASEDPSEIAARLDESRRIRVLLDGLPAHHRDALVMREFDGRSHEEIGSALGMSAPQVKALIHRAKKGFRRAWEVQAGRASVFAWPAVLVAPIRWLRRSLSPARDAAAEVAAPVIQLSSQPVIAHVTALAGDRVAAAAGALLVAGTIGLGAAALPNRSQTAPNRQAPNVAVVESADQAQGFVAATRETSVTATTAPAAPVDGGLTRPRPRASYDDPAPQERPSPDPVSTLDPTPEPSAAPQSPAFEMLFRMSRSTDQLCGCRPDGRIVEAERTVGSPGESIRFGQGVDGAILDAEGDAAFEVRVHYRGTVEGESGTLNVDLTVTNGGNVYTYTARLNLSDVEKHGAHEWRYAFAGAYTLSGGETGPREPLQRDGSLGIELRFWEDGSIFRADLTASY